MPCKVVQSDGVEHACVAPNRSHPHRRVKGRPRVVPPSREIVRQSQAEQAFRKRRRPARCLVEVSDCTVVASGEELGPRAAAIGFGLFGLTPHHLVEVRDGVRVFTCNEIRPGSCPIAVHASGGEADHGREGERRFLEIRGKRGQPAREMRLVVVGVVGQDDIEVAASESDRATRRVKKAPLQ